MTVHIFLPRELSAGRISHAELCHHGGQRAVQADPLGQERGFIKRVARWKDWISMDRCHYDAAPAVGLDASPGTAQVKLTVPAMCIADRGNLRIQASLRLESTWSAPQARLEAVDAACAAVLAVGLVELSSSWGPCPFSTRTLSRVLPCSVACFLTRGDLYQSWEAGMKVFEERLLDADFFLNAANWQWLSASTFFHQYYRVYSPVTFGKKYDPEGKFIRQFLPQVRDDTRWAQGQTAGKGGGHCSPTADPALAASVRNVQAFLGSVRCAAQGFPSQVHI